MKAWPGYACLSSYTRAAASASIAAATAGSAIETAVASCNASMMMNGLVAANVTRSCDRTTIASCPVYHIRLA